MKYILLTAFAVFLAILLSGFAACVWNLVGPPELTWMAGRDAGNFLVVSLFGTMLGSVGWSIILVRVLDT